MYTRVIAKYMSDSSEKRQKRTDSKQVYTGCIAIVTHTGQNRNESAAIWFGLEGSSFPS